MITGVDASAWIDGHADGIIRDDRRPLPDDGLLWGVTCALGDPEHGPSVTMAITRRLYPRKAPTHLHKTDTFRMALGEPIVVGRTTYRHGEFRLQQADTYYGPEVWNDATGTNQVLIMADRRGGRPYLTTPELQVLSDLAGSAEADAASGWPQLPRDAPVDHDLRNNFGAVIRAAHFDGSFSDTAAWPRLSDGSRLAVVALGDAERGPLVLAWDRPGGAEPFPQFTSASDLIRLVVDGSLVVGPATVPRMAFRLHQASTPSAASAPGPLGAQELWFVGDRRNWGPVARERGAGATVLGESVAEVDALLAEPRSAAATVRRSQRRSTAPSAAGGPASAALEIRLAVGDDELAPYYATVVDTACDAVVAFTDPTADPADTDRSVDALHRDTTRVDRLRDPNSGRWFFRFGNDAGAAPFRSMPCATEQDMEATIELVRANAATAPVIDRRG